MMKGRWFYPDKTIFLFLLPLTMQQILETERLLLRKLRPSDAPFILDLVNTPGWLQYIGDRNIHSLGEAVKYIENGPMASYEKYGFGLYLVALRPSGEPVGMCGFLQRDFLNDPDIGFAFLPKYTGLGYAYEMADAGIRYLADSWGKKRLLGITLPHNQPSVGLLKKLGFQYERTMQKPGDTEELLVFGKQLNPE